MTKHNNIPGQQHIDVLSDYVVIQGPEAARQTALTVLRSLRDIKVITEAARPSTYDVDHIAREVAHIVAAVATTQIKKLLGAKSEDQKPDAVAAATPETARVDAKTTKKVTRTRSPEMLAKYEEELKVGHGYYSSSVNKAMTRQHAIFLASKILKWKVVEGTPSNKVGRKPYTGVVYIHEPGEAKKHTMMLRDSDSKSLHAVSLRLLNALVKALVVLESKPDFKPELYETATPT
jgi:hypothetical protein